MILNERSKVDSIKTSILKFICFHCYCKITRERIVCEKCGKTLHVNCSNDLIDHDVLPDGSQMYQLFDYQFH